MAEIIRFRYQTLLSLSGGLHINLWKEITQVWLVPSQKLFIIAPKTHPHTRTDALVYMQPETGSGAVHGA